MYQRIIRLQRDVFLQVQERLIGIALHLQTFRPLQKRLGEVIIEIDGHTQVLNSLGEVATAREYQTP